MSYAEAKADRRRRRKSADMAVMLSLLQGLGQTLMRQKEIREGRQADLDKENRNAERQDARDKADRDFRAQESAKNRENQIKIAELYSKGRRGKVPSWVAEGRGLVKKYGAKSPDEAIAMIDAMIKKGREQEGLLFDDSPYQKDIRALSRIAGLGADDYPEDESEAAVPPGMEDYNGPLGPVQSPPGLLGQRPKAEVQPTNDQESNPSMVPGAPDPKVEAQRQAMQDLINRRRTGSRPPVYGPPAPTEAVPDLSALDRILKENAYQMPGSMMERADSSGMLQREVGGDQQFGIGARPMPTPGAAGMGPQPRLSDTDWDLLRRKVGQATPPARRQQQGRGPMAGGAPPVSASQAAYWRMGDAYRRFQAGDPSGWMELNDLFGGILPAPKGMGLDMNYPRNSFSGLGTTTLPY